MEFDSLIDSKIAQDGRLEAAYFHPPITNSVEDAFQKDDSIFILKIPFLRQYL